MPRSPSTNERGSRARLFAVPPDVEPEVVEPPPDLIDPLVARPVVALPALSLPDDREADERLGLDVAEADIYHEIAVQLRISEDGPPLFGTEHWMLGTLAGAQGDPEPSTVLLLHLSADLSLNFDFLDAGTLQFRIPHEALAAGAWGETVILADSC